MQGISIFQQIYAPRVAHVVTDFDGVSHNTHSPYAMGGVVGSVGKMTAIVANDQADTWHIVNLKCGNLFDAVAVLGAFDESEAANMAMRYHGQYFDAVCGDVCESNTGGLQRFLNHPVYMRTNRPVYAEELAKLQDIPSTQAILWDGVQLKSHNGSSKHLLLDMMRCDDDKALLEKMDFVEEESKLDGEIAEYDALVVEAYKLEGTVSKLALAMDKATSISTLKVTKQTLSKPKTMRGFGVIQQLVSFELSDGQSVSIIFNVSDSEANASAKMTKDDLLVAWKYKLNSRDITAAVQPNATQNVSLNMIASRIMGLADANSEKFVAAQKKKDAMQTELANTNQRVKDLQGQEQALLQEIADLQKQLDEKAKNKALQEAESRAEIEGMAKAVQSAPQDRPTDYRTNLESARAVAKSLGIETKGKKLNTLLKEIGVFDENEVKKELLAEFKALASRLVLPKGYVFDLSSAEESVDIFGSSIMSAWIEKQGKTDTNYIRIELRAVTDAELGTLYNRVHIYTDDKKTKAELDKLNYQFFGDIGTSKPTTPKATVEKMEQFLIKAVFPKIEYLKVLNSTNVDVSKLSEIGIAEITDIGNENLYFEKDGKYYISKVGNPQLYALGEWDFAKYPDGKPVNEPVVQTGARYESPKELFLKKANKAYKDLEDNGLKGFAKRANDVVQDVASNIVSLEDAEKRLNGIIYESENPLVSGEWRDLGDRKVYFWEDMRYGEIVDTRKTEGRSKNVSNPWRTGDGKLFESLPVAKKHELETTSKYRFINDGYMQKTKSSETQQPESEPQLSSSDTRRLLIKNFSELAKKAGADSVVDGLAQGYAQAYFFDASTKKTSVVVLDISANVLPPSGEEWVFEKHSKIEVSDGKNNVIATFSPTKENILKAFDAANEYISKQGSQPESEPPMTNPDRDYLQSIIDGKVDPLTVDIDAVIALAEKYDGDAEITPLLDQALEVINQAEQEAAKGI